MSLEQQRQSVEPTPELKPKALLGDGSSAVFKEEPTVTTTPEEALMASLISPKPPLRTEFYDAFDEAHHLVSQAATESELTGEFDPRKNLKTAKLVLTPEQMAELRDAMVKNPGGLVVRELTSRDEEIIRAQTLQRVQEMSTRADEDGSTDQDKRRPPEDVRGEPRQYQPARRSKESAVQKIRKGAAAALTLIGGLFVGSKPAEAHNVPIDTPVNPVGAAAKVQEASQSSNEPEIGATGVIEPTIGSNAFIPLKNVDLLDGGGEELQKVTPITEADKKLLNDDGIKGETFPRTGYKVQGKFYEYWRTHGGMAQQGNPISDRFREVGPDGVERVVQYFERAKFEFHPENQPPYDILLSRLGSQARKAAIADGTLAKAHVPTAAELNGFNPLTLNITPIKFNPADTPQSINGLFASYWQSHGGLPQHGYPLSEPLVVVSPVDGKPYVTQYFERDVFEWHPEVTDPNFKVLLSLLGVADFNDKYTIGPDNALFKKVVIPVDTATPVPNPSGTATPGEPMATATATATETPKPVEGPKIEKADGAKFGGVKVTWKYDSTAPTELQGKYVGFTSPERGLSNIDQAQMDILVAQGKYGSSQAEVEAHLQSVKDKPQAERLMEIDVPIVDMNAPKTLPSTVTGKRVLLIDPEKEFTLSTEAPPIEFQLSFANSTEYDGALWEKDHGLVFSVAEQRNMNPTLVLSDAGYFWKALEAAANIENIEPNYLSKHNGIGRQYNPNVPTKVNPLNFVAWDDAKTRVVYRIFQGDLHK